jgi:hypothetical protein
MWHVPMLLYNLFKPRGPVLKSSYRLSKLATEVWDTLNPQPKRADGVRKRTSKGQDP